jgi:predicted O-methyltransferase YrrM
MKTFTEAYNEVKHLEDSFSIDPKHLEEIFYKVRELNFNNSRIVEIGSHKGFSTCVLAAAAPQATILSVDNSLHVPYTERQELFDRLGYKNISVLNTDSVSFLQQAVNICEQYEMIFHDAGHGNGVIHEYVLASALLRDDNILIIHDWEQITKQSQVSEMMNSAEGIELVDDKGRTTLITYIL